jgi:hypothetical protein
MPSTPASERPAGDCSTGLWGDAVPRSGTEARAMVSSADVTERLMARFEGQVPLIA